jgi:hypothetical protein
MASGLPLADRVGSLRREVAAHKAAIRRHRAQLGEAATRLTQVEAECRRLGIGFTVQTSARSDQGVDPWRVPR